VRLVADSHIAVWYAQNSPQLSSAARDALDGVDADGGIVVSVATLIDLWYVTRTTEGVTRTNLTDYGKICSPPPSSTSTR